MKIIFFELTNSFKEIFPKELYDNQILCFPQPLKESTVPTHHKDAQIISVFFYSRIIKKVLDQFPDYKSLLHGQHKNICKQLVP